MATTTVKRRNKSKEEVTMNQEEELKQPKYQYSTLFKIATASTMGLVFGTLFSKSRVFEPKLIQGQFLLKNFVMLKVFMGASGSSAAVFWMCNTLGEKTLFDNVRRKKEKGFSRRKYTGVLIGSMISGAGMSIGGACPGMVLSQVGTGVPNSLYTYIGGFAGAFVYGILYDILFKPFLMRPENEQPHSQLYFDKQWKISTSNMLGAFAVFALACGVALEVVFPWKNDLVVPNNPNCTPLNCRSIPPSIAGMLLGLLQYPAMKVLDSFLGASSSYCCVTGTTTNILGKKRFPYLASYGNLDISRWWQVLYVNFGILGAYCSEMAAGGLVYPEGLTVVEAGLGGFMMVFGARMAHGCTTGHGLSGMPSLLKPSLLAVCGMFAAGIATGFLRQHLNM